MASEPRLLAHEVRTGCFVFVSGADVCGVFLDDGDHYGVERRRFLLPA